MYYYGENVLIVSTVHVVLRQKRPHHPQVILWWKLSHRVQVLLRQKQPRRIQVLLMANMFLMCNVNINKKILNEI